MPDRAAGLLVTVSPGTDHGVGHSAPLIHSPYTEGKFRAGPPVCGSRMAGQVEVVGPWDCRRCCRIAVCGVCGSPAVWYGRGAGDVLRYMCAAHKDTADV